MEVTLLFSDLFMSQCSGAYNKCFSLSFQASDGWSRPLSEVDW